MQDYIKRFRNLIETQYETLNYSNATGEDAEKLLSFTKCSSTAELETESARNIEALCHKAKICILPFDLFPDHVDGLKCLKNGSLSRRIGEVYSLYPELRSHEREEWKRGSFRAEIDFDHITPDWSRLLRYGWYGLALQLETYGGFCGASARACRAVCALAGRFSEACGDFINSNGDPYGILADVIVIDAEVRANVLAPKMSLRVSDKTPPALLDRIAHFIRDESGHCVITNDRPAIKALGNVGISCEDAYEYAPIGCYEPAVVGREVGCTGATSLNIAKAVELALNSGIDLMSGLKLGAETEPPEKINSFAVLMDAVKSQLSFLSNEILQTMRTYEKHYREISPSLLLSATMRDCLENNRSAYNGGLPYNNTACNCGSIGSAADSLYILKKYVFERKALTLAEFTEILRHNWDGDEKLHRQVLTERDKWENSSIEVDKIAHELSDYVAGEFNGKPNGRGGVFKTGLYSINRAYIFGAATGATPDGRYAGEALSKNLCAAPGMDFNGVTAQIKSVLGLDITKFPNGSVLDLMLHPSVLIGEDGLVTLRALILTYINGGGFGIQFNVFDAETLRAAQKEPEKYRNLQIRLCGWNVYFVTLTKQQQDIFILEAERSNIN